MRRVYWQAARRGRKGDDHSDVLDPRIHRGRSAALVPQVRVELPLLELEPLGDPGRGRMSCHGRCRTSGAPPSAAAEISRARADSPAHRCRRRFGAARCQPSTAPPIRARCLQIQAPVEARLHRSGALAPAAQVLSPCCFSSARSPRASETVTRVLRRAGWDLATRRQPSGRVFRKEALQYECPPTLQDRKGPPMNASTGRLGRGRIAGLTVMSRSRGLATTRSTRWSTSASSRRTNTSRQPKKVASGMSSSSKIRIVGPLARYENQVTVGVVTGSLCAMRYAANARTNSSP